MTDGPGNPQDASGPRGSTSGDPRGDPEHPAEGGASTRIARALRLASLSERYGTGAAGGLFALVNGFLSIALMALAALVSHQPFIFPSLGPTAFLLFSSPLAPQSSPRNAFFGHLVGVFCRLMLLPLLQQATSCRVRPWKTTREGMPSGLGNTRVSSLTLTIKAASHA